MDEIKITKGAYKLIQYECLRWNTETGGILIGTLNTPIVLEATTPGEKSKLSFASYTNDPSYDNWMLSRAIEKYKGKVKLVGYWHKHPGTLTEPSLGDLKQTHELAGDIAKDRDNRPLFIFIVNIIKEEVKIYPYSIKYGTNFKSISLRVIDDNSEEIKQTLKNEPVLIRTKTTDFWTDPDFQFYFTRVGKERLKREIGELKDSGYEVKVFRKSTTKRVYLEISKNKITCTCILPIEYPLNPPKILINKHPIMLLIQYWNSDCSIKQVLDIILKKTLSKAKPCIKEIKVREHSLTNKVIKATLGYLKEIRKILIRGSR